MNESNSHGSNLSAHMATFVVGDDTLGHDELDSSG
jgi:hypothetical protein